jgi:hypothetical protein
MVVHFARGLVNGRRGVWCGLHDARRACVMREDAAFVGRLCDTAAVDGVSICKPPDQFCRDTGRKLALAHALGRYGLDKASRAAVWARYLDRQGPKLRTPSSARAAVLQRRIACGFEARGVGLRQAGVPALPARRIVRACLAVLADPAVDEQGQAAQNARLRQILLTGGRG